MSNLNQDIKNMLAGLQGIVKNVEEATKNSIKNTSPEEAEKMAKQIKDEGLEEKLQDMSKKLAELNTIVK